MTYLRNARGRPNLAIYTHAPMRRVLLEDGRAAGVAFDRGGTPQTLRCRREVIVSAGAIKSPQLLMLSSIGCGEQLARFGIPVVRDLPAVGEIWAITRFSR